MISDGLIGDTVLLQDFIRECINYFDKYEIDLLICWSLSFKFFNDCCIKDDRLNLIDCSFDKGDETYCRNLITMIRVIRGHEYEYVINPLPLSISDKIVGCIYGKNKITIRDSTAKTGGVFFSIYKKIAYTHTINVKSTEMEFLRYKKLLNHLGDKDYLIQQPIIDKMDGIQVFDKVPYCVIAAGASEPGKLYNPCRFAKIADHIIDHYGLKVVFIGSGQDSKCVDLIISMMKNSNVINLVNKTNNFEWVAVIRDSVLVIGNDSASIHISAAVGRTAICIAGKWQYKRFYPYVYDLDNYNSPEVIFCEAYLECENCGKIRKIMPKKECRDTIFNGKSYYCLDLVSLEVVLDAIDDNLSMMHFK